MQEHTNFITEVPGKIYLMDSEITHSGKDMVQIFFYNRSQ